MAPKFSITPSHTHFLSLLLFYFSLLSKKLGQFTFFCLRWVIVFFKVVFWCFAKYFFSSFAHLNHSFFSVVVFQLAKGHFPNFREKSKQVEIRIKAEKTMKSGWREEIKKKEAKGRQYYPGDIIISSVEKNQAQNCEKNELFTSRTLKRESEKKQNTLIDFDQFSTSQPLGQK